MDQLLTVKKPAVLLFVVVLLGLAGCNPASDSPQASDNSISDGTAIAGDESNGNLTQNPTPGERSVNVPTFPVTAEYQDLVVVEQQLDFGASLIVERCLLEQGFPRIPATPPNTDVMDTMPIQDFYTVRPDPASVETDGFDALPLAAMMNASQDANTLPVDLSPEEEIALNDALYGNEQDWEAVPGNAEVGSFSVSGCYGTARERLTGDAGGFGPLMEQRRLLEFLRGDAYELAIADTRNREALVEWQSCMADNGFGNYEHPNDVVPTLIEAREQGESRTELEIAVGNSRCFEQSRMQEIWDRTIGEAEEVVAQTLAFRDVRQWGDANCQAKVARSVTILAKPTSVSSAV